MSCYRKFFIKIFVSLLFLALISFNTKSFAQDGEKLFKDNCANCHKPLEDYTGPALKGARAKEQTQTGFTDGSIILQAWWRPTRMPRL
jgi:cytochrome c551/c552